MATSKSSKESKASRITVACNSCRSRKQKCSGNKPICTQCLQSHRQCDWPEQLKRFVLRSGSENAQAHQTRGPAKGYDEALEHRLRETEQALLSLLAHMTDEQVAIAVERDQCPTQGRYSPSLRSGKNDAQYWRRYPLRTARGLREWQLACSVETRVSPSRRTEVSAQSEAEADENSPVASEPQQTELQVVPRFQVTSAHEVKLKSTQMTQGKGMNQWGAWQNGHDLSNELRESPTTSGHIYIPSSLESTQLQDTQPLHAVTPPGPSLWSEAPPVAFQRQFLW